MGIAKGRHEFTELRARAWGSHMSWLQARREKRQIICTVASDFSGFNRFCLIDEDADRRAFLDDVVIS